MSVKITYPWGLVQDTFHHIWTSIKSTSPGISNPPFDFDLNDYLNFKPLTVDDASMLSTTELGIELTNPKFIDLVNYATEIGLIRTNMAIKTVLSNDSEYIRLFMDSSVENRFFFVTRNGESVFIEYYEPNSISFFDREGGMSYNLSEFSLNEWGIWAEHSGCSIAQCMTNCILFKAPLHLIGNISRKIGVILSLPDCVDCLKSGANPDIPTCTKCIAGLAGIPGLGEGVDIWECLRCCRDENCRQNYCCDPLAPPTGKCYTDDNGVLWGARFTCVGGALVLAAGYPQRCDSTCIYIIGGEEAYKACLVSLECEEGVCGCMGTPDFVSKTRISTARDPNRKMGPQGNVVAGQKLDYRVEYENEGEGIAFGVYFTDTLDEDLDDSTLEIGPVINVHTGLQIAPPGIYISATRTIIWFVGQVDPNHGGYADFSMSVKPDAINGTEIINFATVYFPSVPEATRTNGIVSIVSLNHTPVVDAGPDVTLNEGQLLSRVGSFVDDDIGDSWFATVNYGDGSALQTLELDGKTFRLSHTYTKEGVFEVTVSVTDSWGEFGVDKFIVTVVIPPAPPNVSVNISSQNIQYSDSIDDVIFTATNFPSDRIHALVSYSTDGGKTFGTHMTDPPMLVPPDAHTIPGGLRFIGDVYQVGTGTWTLTGVADLAPGSYIIRLRVSDSNGASASADTTINVFQEDALATYVGAESVSTPSASENVATVELLAVIQDITAVNPALDSDAGNITKALVTFVNRDSGEVIAERIPVMLLDPEDITVGVARYGWVVNLGSQDSASLTVGIIVNGYYTRNSSDDNTVVTVSKAVEGSSTGGG